jgi:hypothetical protein
MVRAPGTLFTATALVATFALTSNSRRYQPISPASPATQVCPLPPPLYFPFPPQFTRVPPPCTPHYYCLPKSPSPPRGRLRLFDLPSPLPGTEAYQLAAGNVGNVSLKSDTTQEIETHPPS